MVGSASAHNRDISRSFRIRTALLGIASLLLAAVSFAAAGGTALANGSPDLALRLAPGNPAALVAKADAIMLAAPVTGAADASALATAAARAQPLNPRALRILGYAADLKGRLGQAARLIALSTRMSRRDVGAQLWLIEYSVRVGDVDGALAHYDLALSTGTSSTNLLYQTLTNALAEPAVRRGLVRYLARRRPWLEDFLGYAIAHSAQPSAIGKLIVESPGFLADPAHAELGKRLVERSISDGDALTAQLVYLAAPEHTRARLISPSFASRDRDWADGAVGWRLLETPDGAALLIAGGGGDGLQMHLQGASDTLAKLAQRTLFLTPNSYVFGVQIRSTTFSNGGFVRFRLHCADFGDMRELWSREVVQPGKLRVQFTVDSRCAMQVLEVEMAGGDGSQGSTADIGSPLIVVDGGRHSGSEGAAGQH